MWKIRYILYEMGVIESINHFRYWHHNSAKQDMKEKEYEEKGGKNRIIIKRW
jgi:hypothetical protein